MWCVLDLPENICFALTWLIIFDYIIMQSVNFYKLNIMAEIVCDKVSMKIVGLSMG